MGRQTYKRCECKISYSKKKLIFNLYKQSNSSAKGEHPLNITLAFRPHGNEEEWELKLEVQGRNINDSYKKLIHTELFQFLEKDQEMKDAINETINRLFKGNQV